MFEKRVDFSSSVNSRFVGDGKKLIRSDAVLSFNENDIRLLKMYEIENIVDLRSINEMKKSPCEYPDYLTYHHIPLHENGILPTCEDEIGEFYFDITKAETPMYNVLSTLAAIDKGTLLFCRSGKDRTGIVSAILLSLCGYDDDTVADDYAMSNIALKDIIYLWIQSHPEYETGAVTPLKCHILSFFRLLREKYSTVTDYCLHIGISDSEFTRLKKIVGGNIFIR